jgi:competence protein ComK
MGKKNQTLSYTICSNTYALLPYTDGRRTGTRVIEDRSEFLVEESTYKIVTTSCSFYRGSIASATLYSQKAVRVKHKPPIIIGEYYGNPLIFFPTHSPKNKDAVWFNFDAVDLVESDDSERGGSIVYLSNGETVHLDVSPIALRNQHSFAGSLRRYFKRAQEMHKHQMSYIAKRTFPPRTQHPLD